MFFPEWAPSSLVEEFNRLQDKANNYRRWFDERVEEGSLYPPQNMDDIDRARHRGENYIELAAETDELAGILSRLLTHEDMKDVWIALPSRPSSLPKIRDPGLPEYLLWDCIVRTLRDFKYQMVRPQTPAQKVKSLQSVIDKAQALIDAIAEDGNAASKMAWDLMAIHLAEKNIKHRQNIGDSPSWAEFQMPLTLMCDCGEAKREEQKKADDDESELEDCRWCKTPLVSRLAYWAEEAEKTRLTDLLQLFVSLLKNEVKEPPEIKQPGRSDAAIKPFIIRRLSRHMEGTFGKPLDDIVACIITVVLNLDFKNSLTRDDVRPYVAIHGKKLD